MKINLIVGAVVGLLAAGLLFVLHATEVLRTPLGSQLLILTLAFHVTGLIVALGFHRHRAKDEGGAPFSRLFGAGLMVSLIVGVILGLGTQVFVTHVDPTYLDWVKETSLEQLDQMEEISEEEKARHREQVERLTLEGYAVETLKRTLVVGFFLSLTLAALFRMRAVQATKTA
ncbi:MAG: DUF4199 domain-containing protein [Acidobacteriota bacterium]